MVVYGGATGGGGLAPDELYLLDLRKGDTSAAWMIVKVSGPTPGKRYGHSMSYMKPHIVIYGGHAGSELQNDTWVLSIEKLPFIWERLGTSESPPARIYHSATLCSFGKAVGSLFIFGGRASDQNPLYDTWYLKKLKDNKWEWAKAVYKTQKVPAVRFQVY